MPVVPGADLAEGHACGSVARRDSAHVKDRAEVVYPYMVEAHSKEVRGQLDERDVGPGLRLEYELLPGCDSPRLALQGDLGPMVDVEHDELLHRKEGVVLEQDGGGALENAFFLRVVAHELPQLDPVDLGEPDQAEHVGKRVGPTIASASLIDKDAIRPEALRKCA